MNYIYTASFQNINRFFGLFEKLNWSNENLFRRDLCSSHSSCSWKFSPPVSGIFPTEEKSWYLKLQFQIGYILQDFIEDLWESWASACTKLRSKTQPMWKAEESDRSFGNLLEERIGCIHYCILLDASLHRVWMSIAIFSMWKSYLLFWVIWHTEWHQMTNIGQSHVVLWGIITPSISIMRRYPVFHQADSSSDTTKFPLLSSSLTLYGHYLGKIMTIHSSKTCTYTKPLELLYKSFEPKKTLLVSILRRYWHLSYDLKTSSPD